MVTITFDTREQTLYELFQNIQEDGLAVNTEQRVLDIGDILIENLEPPVCLIFERKTEKDLLASIKDGRYREQKLRMMHTYPSHACTYIIESPQGWKASYQNSTFQGALYHSMYRDKLHVVVVPSMKDTAQWLYALAKKIQENPHKFAESVCNPMTHEVNYVEHVKVKSRKIENIDREACYMMQWCQIPGISAKIAKVLVDRYPSWKCFLEDMDACQDEEARVKKLCSISMIGEKKARTIIAYM